MTAQLPCVLPYDDAAIATAARIIAEGGIVAVPTETVYGLAADARDADAVARIYAAKGRPAFNPLIVHVLDLAAAEAIGIFDARSREFAERFWPGPLTLVVPLRTSSGLAEAVSAGLDTVAIRVPAHRAIRALLIASQAPLAAPSANASNGISPTRAEHVVHSLGARVALVIDDGACAAGLESTILMGDHILRPGPIGAEDLRAVAGGGDGTVRAPGQLKSHYAPAKPLLLDMHEAGPDTWHIGFGEVAGNVSLSPSGDLVEAAARLFAALHEADGTNSSEIAVAPIPMRGVGVAINDRLRRAAHR